MRDGVERDVDLIRRELRAICGARGVPDAPGAHYLHDATEHQGLRGRASAVALPGSEGEVARVLRWCHDHDVPVAPRGGGTGLAGGCVPLDGEVVLSLERLTGVPALDPGSWRMQVEAGVRTATVRRLAREHGLYYPPDPGAAEDSQIGGNVATNAGGPHAFKYGVTGAWVTGLRAVLIDGETVEVGGPLRKDVAGYDLRSLLVGSEGTLAVITAAWLRLIPAPAAAAPVTALYPDAASGCRALEAVLASGLVPAALEYLDAGALRAAGRELPRAGARGGRVHAAGGGRRERRRGRGAERASCARCSPMKRSPCTRRRGRAAIERLWRWRSGVTLAVVAQHGGKLSEDVAVPLDRIERALAGTLAIGARHGLDSCSWGHAGDGNLHATFMLAADDPEQVRRAEAAALELFELARELGGSVTGEHGIGWAKRGQLERQLSPAALRLQREVKAVFDPKGLLNPGKKTA